IASGSSDAVNGGQLYDSLDSIATALGGGTYVGATGGLVGTSYIVQGGSYFNVGDAIAAIDAAVTSLEGRIDGVETTPTSGTDPRVAVGGSEEGGDGAVITDGSDGVAIGSEASAGGENGVAVGAGAHAAGTGDTAIGAGAHVGADNSTGIGANSNISAAATNAVAIGAGSSVTAASGTAVGQGASVTANNAVALGQGSVADRANTVSVGSEGNERAITNVAAGTVATDAANVGQMQAGDTATLSAANTYTDSRFAAIDDDFANFRTETDRRFLDQDRRIDRAGAMGSAMLNMATSVAGIRTENRVGVGVGFQGGEKALSIGYQRALSDRATITIGGAFSGDEKSVGVGAGFGW
ncbi:MAG TPA: YadA-like family protein, partial [Pseudoxanthomonas sp.]|nr:YadA-like family protein [Pseudoxanthomonas sp.]